MRYAVCSGTAAQQPRLPMCTALGLPTDRPADNPAHRTLKGNKNCRDEGTDHPLAISAARLDKHGSIGLSQEPTGASMSAPEQVTNRVDKRRFGLILIRVLAAATCGLTVAYAVIELLLMLGFLFEPDKDDAPRFVVTWSALLLFWLFPALAVICGSLHFLIRARTWAVLAAAFGLAGAAFYQVSDFLLNS